MYPLALLVPTRGHAAGNGGNVYVLVIFLAVFALAALVVLSRLLRKRRQK